MEYGRRDNIIILLAFVAAQCGEVGGVPFLLLRRSSADKKDGDSKSFSFQFIGVVLLRLA